MLHRAHRACFGAMITTARNMRDLRADDLAIDDLGAAGLSRPWVIRLARITTFEEHPRIRPVGTLARPERRPVATLLARWLGV